MNIDIDINLNNINNNNSDNLMSQFLKNTIQNAACMYAKCMICKIISTILSTKIFANWYSNMQPTMHFQI